MRLLNSAVVLGAMVAFGCGGESANTNPTAPTAANVNGTSTATAKMDVVETAVKNGKFTKLAAALQAAGLVDALKGPGPFTVFAPTDEAFAKLPAGTWETWTKPENKEKLSSVLKFHVVNGQAAKASDVMTWKNTPSFMGQDLMFKTEGSSVWVNNAKVVMADVECTNGMIHAIDTVLMPEEKKADVAPMKMDILGTAEKAGNFKMFGELVMTAGLTDTLKGNGPFTVFAPTDEAFAKVDKKALENLKKDKKKLEGVLKYHVFAGKMMAADVVKAKTIKTVQGKEIKVKMDKDTVMLDKSKVTKTDIEASNGVIHVVDMVMMP